MSECEGTIHGFRVCKFFRLLLLFATILEPKFLFSVYALSCILPSIRSLMLQANHIWHHCIIWKLYAYSIHKFIQVLSRVISHRMSAKFPPPAALAKCVNPKFNRSPNWGSTPRYFISACALSSFTPSSWSELFCWLAGSIPGRSSVEERWNKMSYVSHIHTDVDQN